MVLAYGSFKHPVGQPKVSFLADAIMNQGEVVVGYKVRVDIMGLIVTQSPNAQADISAQIAAIKAAYSKPNQNVILYLADGVTPSQNVLLANQTLGGIRVTRAPSFPEGGTVEYATIRTFSVALEAEVPAAGPNVLWSFKEKLSFVGSGGPIWDIAQPIAGPGIPQIIKLSSPCQAIQRGEAVGYLDYWGPRWNAPKWPLAELQYLREIDMDGPRRIGQSYKEFPTTWTYHFKSVLPLAGTATATLWPLSN
jgi:hypothetical protein